MDEKALLEIVSFVSAQGILKDGILRAKVVETIASRIKSSVPELQSHAKNLEMLKLICSCVENVVQKKHKIDKKDVALDIVRSCFPLLQPQDIEIIGQNIDVLCMNGCIKKVSSYKRWKRWLCTREKKGSC